ncbi:cryptochrome/photolyase family protein [Algirhabdus cladophorae]|uniref:cryptochrome/photolyase family protein n=1 Tax=Algirhabdus cladophorae TaxID=3377108 RepID=UPI003B847F0E
MNTPILLWLRRDLRLVDHPALVAACEAGAPVIPVFIHDQQVSQLGAAPKWRLGLSLAQLEQDLRAKGSQLILRRGTAQQVLEDLIAETGAGSVYWSRLYDPAAIERDTQVKSALKARGITARSFGGHVMFEPMSVETKTGGFYKVFTPMWKSVRTRDVPQPLAEPAKIPAPEAWPASDALDSWAMGAAMQRGADVVLPYTTVGQAKALERLHAFCDGPIGGYTANRDLPWKRHGTSRLSENLALGEISPTQCWHAGKGKLDQGVSDAEVFLKELVWREFAYHLAFHTPRIVSDNWKEDWDAFPWNTDETDARVIAWKQGRTGIQFVDAAMREMYVTGTMHNRGRMIVASYLTKHLMCHWKIGMNWFADCLIDWDPASNAMGWQWSSGSGPDATPYFRVFNPVTQLDKFDKHRSYVSTWLAEGRSNPAPEALAYFEAIPKKWSIAATDTYPQPIVNAADGRQIALDAYSNRGF